MKKVIIEEGEFSYIEEETLSDDSLTWNVVITAGPQPVYIATVDLRQAEQIFKALESAVMIG